MRTSVILCALSLFLLQSVFAQQSKDQTLSPYFHVQSEEENQFASFPLLSTDVDVNISGVIADVTVTQTYLNNGQNSIEAVYVFPASTRAAVHAMEMLIGNRTIQAEIKERNQARVEYEQAKEEGRRASLLEQDRPNVFQMSVANILPNDTVKVVLHYTELLIPEAGIYSFVYPTVVGPRYTESSRLTASTNDQFTNMPYGQEGGLPASLLDVKVELMSGIPIKEVACSSHKVEIHKKRKTANIQLKSSERYGGNRDFILEYRLTGGKIASGLMTYEHDDENYFLLMMQPPERVIEDEIPPREYIFVMDVSGSMRGFPTKVTKTLLTNLVSKLRPYDRFNVLFFSGGSNWLAEESLTANSANIQSAIELLSSRGTGGGTRLLPALKNGLNLPRCEEGVSRSIVVITDGYVSVEREAFDLVRQNLDAANLFAFGIGSSVNRHLIEGLAHAGMGEPFIVTSEAEATIEAERFRTYIQSPVLSNVRVTYDGFDAYDIEPLSIPDLLADRPLIIYGKYKGEAKGSISINGYTGQGEFQQIIALNDAQPHPRQAALRMLWARERIRTLDDYQKLNPYSQDQLEITRLGLKYSLMTAYTSFLAVETDRIANKNDVVEKVKQPLPMPQDVSNAAVGFDLEIEGVVRHKKTERTSIIKAIWANDEHVAIPKILNTEIEAYLSDVPVLLQEEMLIVNSIQFGIDEKGQLILIQVNGLKPSIAMQFWIESWKLSSAQILKNTQINISL